MPDGFEAPVLSVLGESCGANLDTTGRRGAQGATSTAHAAARAARGEAHPEGNPGQGVLSTSRAPVLDRSVPISSERRQEEARLKARTSSSTLEHERVRRRCGHRAPQTEGRTSSILRIAACAEAPATPEPPHAPTCRAA